MVTLVITPHHYQHTFWRNTCVPSAIVLAKSDILDDCVGVCTYAHARVDACARGARVGRSARRIVLDAPTLCACTTVGVVGSCILSGSASLYTESSVQDDVLKHSLTIPLTFGGRAEVVLKSILNNEPQCACRRNEPQ